MDRSKSGVVDRDGDPPHAHVLGFHAQGLPGVAESLVRRGMDVTGSLSGLGAPTPGLRDAGVRLRPGSPSRPWTRRTRFLVHGPEVGLVHPVRLGALRRGIPQFTPLDWLGEQMAGRFGVAFAGGRLASTAAAMTGLILAGAGRDPSVLLETPARQFGGWSRVGDGDAFVVDWPGPVDRLASARPRLAVLLGAGCGPFCSPRRWAEAVEDGGKVLALGHPASRPAGLDGVPAGWISLRQGADWWATDLREDSGRFRFRIFHQGRYVIEVRLRTHGLRNVVGALAAAAASETLGVSPDEVRHGLEEFAGLSRDFEARGSFRGVTLVDDEAADAGSVYDALAMARRAYRGRRLWAVFAPPDDPTGSGDVPRTESREAEVRRYVAAFALADLVTIIEDRPTEPTPRDRRPPLTRFLTRALEDAGVRVRPAAGFAEATSELDRQLEPGDVLLTLGAGDVGTIADAFIRRLPRDRPGG